MKHFLLAIVLLLPGCGLFGGGGGGDRRNTIHVRQLPDQSDPNVLGYTVKDGSRRWVSGIRASLMSDQDPDKVVRVVIHELFQPAHMAESPPPEADRTWYVLDGDAQVPYAPVTLAEVQWLRTVIDRPFGVIVDEEWLREPVRLALQRIRASFLDDTFYVR